MSGKSIIWLLYVLIGALSSATEIRHNHHNHQHYTHEGRNLNGIAIGYADENGYYRCATPDPTRQDRRITNRLVKDWKRRNANNRPRNIITVDTYFHVIQDNFRNGNLDQTDLTNSLNAMNGAFSEHGFQFVQAGADFTTNTAWFNAAYGSGAEVSMKNNLRQGDATALNVYFNQPGGSGTGLLGYATFPTDYACFPSNDGVVILHSTVPGGSALNYDEGDTLTHEVGHWLGLYHVFEGGTCSGDGDEVSDTPFQKFPTTGCPVSKDSCPQSEGQDSINNMMDYSYDSCLQSFTTGQGERMRALWELRTNPGTNCNPICFSPDATTYVLEKGEVSMKNLMVGDKVLTASGQYKTIYTIDHFHPSKLAPFVRIYTKSKLNLNPLELTPNHMLYIDRSAHPVPAFQITVGDFIKTLQGPKEVIHIERIERQGFYNPLTYDGTIVVDGIVTSSYSSYTGATHVEIGGHKLLPFQTVADMALVPYRTFCMGVSLQLCNLHDELAGANQIMRRIFIFWTQQNNWTKYLMFGAYVSFFGLLNLALRFCLEITIVILFLGTSVIVRKPKKL